jgi:hypothetical protein
VEFDELDELFDELELLDELELPDELELLDELADLPVLDDPEVPPLPFRLTVALPPEVLLLDDPALDLAPVLVAACDDPGRNAANIPAAATLATDTVAVTALSLRCPRSRSATACAM